MHWTTTPQSFIALGFSQASIKILKTLSFLTSWIIQAAVNPVKFLRASLDFTIKNIFKKIQFKYEQILHDMDYQPTEFHSPTIFIVVSKILKTLSFLTSWSIQAVVNPVKFLRASLNFTIKNIFFKSYLNTSRFYMYQTTTPQSFIALGF